MKTYGKVPKSLLAFCQQPSHAIAIDEVGGEGEDGYWIYLKPGFINANLEAHAIHEYTVKAAIDAFLNDVTTCRNSGCREEAHLG